MTLGQQCFVRYVYYNEVHYLPAAMLQLKHNMLNLSTKKHKMLVAKTNSCHFRNVFELVISPSAETDMLRDI